MSTSIYAKLRKQAKAKAKKSQGDNGDSQADQFVKKNIVESPVITEEEINNLLASMNDAAMEISDIQDVPLPPPKVLEEKVEQRLFTAIGVYYDTSRKKFMKISIDYNPKTEYTKVKSIEDLADSNAVATAKVTQIFSMKLIRDKEIL